MEEAKIQILHLWKDPKDAERVVRTLAESGLQFEARLVRTPADLASALKRKRFDLVVVDVGMDNSTEGPSVSTVLNLISGMPLVLLHDSAVPSPGGPLQDHVQRVAKEDLDGLVPAIRLALALPSPHALVKEDEYLALIDSFIHVWEQTPDFSSYAAVLKRDRASVEEGLRASFSAGGPRESGPDAVRAFITGHVLRCLGADLDLKHFSLFKEPETARIILEDSFGVQPGVYEDKILFPHQEKVIGIVVRCLFGRRRKSTDSVDLARFMQFLLGGVDKSAVDHDRIMRYKSLVWFVYLAISLVEIDRENVCPKGIDHFGSRLRDLLERAVEGKIIDEDSAAPGYEGGKWDSTLFGWLQGEDRREFATKLRRQFNLTNRMDHANRLLLSEHRRFIYEQVLELFC